MSQANEEICLAIVKRGLRFYGPHPSYEGPAKNWRKFSEPDFQEFAQKNAIGAETIIAVYYKGNDVFNVLLMH